MASTEPVRSARPSTASTTPTSSRPVDGPLALCIHGFPDTRAAAGCRCSASWPTPASTRWPRSCAATRRPRSRPTGSARSARGSPTCSRCASTSAATRDSVLIGHDWGALTTYGAASAAPDAWRRIVTMSHPPVGGHGHADCSTTTSSRCSGTSTSSCRPRPRASSRPTTSPSSPASGSDWSPSFDATRRARRREGRPARPRQPLRRAEHLPLRVRLRPGRSRVRRVRGGRRSCPTPSRRCTCTATRTAASAARWSSRRRDALPEGSQAELVVGAGHFLQYEQPAVVNRLVVDFVTG